VVESVRSSVASRIAAEFNHAMAQVTQEIANAAIRTAQEGHVDCLVALGGGSAIGVAKAIALTLPLPIVAVPTTYGGSEMTPIWGLTREGRKQTGRNPRVQPRTVIYDPVLTMSLPPRTTACSGMNAIAHCVEALYASDANELTSLAALEGIRILSSALPRLHSAPVDRAQRANALKGAWLAGFSLGTVQMAFHHKLCHTLGGSFGLPHAETHAVLLPFTSAYNRGAAPDAMRRIAGVLEVEDAPAELLELARRIDVPSSLSDIGMKESDIDAAADLAVERQYPNPRPVTRDGVRDLLAAAYSGDASYVTLVSQ
jgi:alcohol dehydrogenase class IV